MKSLCITLVIAFVLTSSLGIAAYVYGYHSTPVIWLAMLNFPGVLFCAWMAGLPDYCLCALANWLTYFLVAEAAASADAWNFDLRYRSSGAPSSRSFIALRWASCGARPLPPNFNQRKISSFGKGHHLERCRHSKRSEEPPHLHLSLPVFFVPTRICHLTEGGALCRRSGEPPHFAFAVAFAVVLAVASGEPREPQR